MPSLVEIVPLVLEKTIFIICPLRKGCGLSFEQAWILFTKECFGWNWPTGSGEEEFLNFVNIFSLFWNYLPLDKGGSLQLNKLESFLAKDTLCQVWLKLPYENVKILQGRQTTDNLWSEKLTWVLIWLSRAKKPMGHIVFNEQFLKKKNLGKTIDMPPLWFLENSNGNT